MKNRVKVVNFKGEVEYQDQAKALLVSAGDVVLVQRGRPRMLVFRCPCGCGDDLLVNLDQRSGPAWRFFLRTDGLTLYPSYWRDGACGSHFILWDNQIYWCHGWDDEDFDWWSVSEDVETRVYGALKKEVLTPYWDVADEVGILPWEALQACRQLMEKKRAERGFGDDEGKYRRR